VAAARTGQRQRALGFRRGAAGPRVSRLPPGRPLVGLVTDRKRLAPSASEAVACARLIDQVGAAARAGVAVVQVRERGLSDAALDALVGRCVEAVAGTACLVLVNDRLDIAMACRAHGVHLRADSYSARRVREIAPDSFVVGRSVHAAGEAAEIREEGGVDYVMYGSVFVTPSKPPGWAAGGLAGLSAAVAAAAPVPVLAIGGMTPAVAADVAGTGAAGLAGIGLWLATDRARLEITVAAVRQAFDSSSVFH